MKNRKATIILILSIVLVILINIGIVLHLENKKKERNINGKKLSISCTKKQEYNGNFKKGILLPFAVSSEEVTYNINYNDQDEIQYYYYTTNIKCTVKEQYEQIKNTNNKMIVDAKYNDETLEISLTYDKQYPENEKGEKTNIQYQTFTKELEKEGYVCN